MRDGAGVDLQEVLPALIGIGKLELLDEYGDGQPTRHLDLPNAVERGLVGVSVLGVEGVQGGAVDGAVEREREGEVAL